MRPWHRARAAALAGVLGLTLVTGCGAAEQSRDPVARQSPPASRADELGPPLGTASPRQEPSLVVPTALRGLTADGPVLGVDVSWPQCPKGTGIPSRRGKGLPMPGAAADFVVLGLTNGPGFTPNPCLADQVDLVRDRRLQAAAYSVLSFPDAATLDALGDQGPYAVGSRRGRLGNVGYQQARYNLATMHEAGLISPIIWMDVEPVSLFEWSHDKAANAAVVRGAARGYTEAGFGVGAYSTVLLWRRIVGDLTLGVPEWRAAGETSRAAALRRCRAADTFQGGQAVIAQWVHGRRDRDLTCPGTSSQMAAWFHQY